MFAGANHTDAGYPLAALVGQDDMVRALLLLAVDPDLGGLLLVGEKGTAKSTAARALAEVLPPIEARLDCPFHCRPDRPGDLCPSCRAGPGPSGPARPPFRTVPLGVTEERLLGGLDWEGTLRGGRPALRPGLLGEANRGLLYVDEVNLLEPSLAHLLLDAVSGGRVAVERDGLSLWHPSRVTLLGSMNPEEGPLGPQLADRFALAVNLRGEADPAARAEIVRRRLAFERDPLAFREAYAPAGRALTARVAAARRVLGRLRPSPGTLDLAARLSMGARAAGHRADLALCRAAMALAAWELADGEPPGEFIEAGPGYVGAVSHLVLPARERPGPREGAPRAVAKVAGRPAEAREAKAAHVAHGEPPPGQGPVATEDGGETLLTVYQVAQTFDLVSPKGPPDRGGPKERSGRRGFRETPKARGRAYKTTARRLGRPLSLSATLRAAAPFQASRREGAGEGASLVLRPCDFREKVYRLKTGRLVLFVVDSSGSIGTLYRMEEAKAAAMSLLADAYRKRDRVALIAFYGQSAELLLPPTNSPDLAGRLLASLPSGGKTPLSAALAMAHRLIAVERSKDPKITPHVILMTDGRPNVPLEPGASPWPEALRLAGRMADDPTVRFLLIDTDRGAYNDFKLTRELSERLRCPRMALDRLRQGLLDGFLGPG
ncbi:MAG: VWA domain-containing protein [Deltaproteobacteria bacterium]|jgi:magnesium chelatase subunit D|nr:VWA domain-containing protein [Deltaproteobacteria bacterium]